MPENLIYKQDSWWARKQKDGQVRERKLHTQHKGTARQRRDKWFSQLQETRWGEKPRRTFEEAAERFAREHFPNLKPKSAKRYDTSLIWLIDHFFGEFLDEIGSEKMLEFENARRKMGVTDSTIIKDFACLSSLFSSAEEWEWVNNNPVKPYKRGRVKRRSLKDSEPRTRYLDHEEETRLLEACTDHFRPLVIFAIDTGLRREEQFSLFARDVNIGREELTVRKEVAKNHRSRTIPLLERALEIAKRRDNFKYVFMNYKHERYSPTSPWIWEELQRTCNRAGIEGLIWHDLRRTCGCRLLQDYEMTMEEVCAWLGHSSVRVTERHYAFLKVDQLRKKIRKN